jgi:hypothetical protein
VHELFQYILGHLFRIQLSPKFAARMLDLHIESTGSLSETVRVTGSLDGSPSPYPLLLDCMRAHAISCFNKALFSPEVREFSCCPCDGLLLSSSVWHVCWTRTSKALAARVKQSVSPVASTAPLPLTRCSWAVPRAHDSVLQQGTLQPGDVRAFLSVFLPSIDVPEFTAGILGSFPQESEPSRSLYRPRAACATPSSVTGSLHGLPAADKVLLDCISGHPIACFNKATFLPEVRRLLSYNNDQQASHRNGTARG